MLPEKAIEFSTLPYLAFVDFKGTADSVNGEVLLGVLEKRYYLPGNRRGIWDGVCRV